MKAKVIAVVGPTASGKTKLAIELAHKLNGEVIYKLALMSSKIEDYTKTADYLRLIPQSSSYGWR